MNEKENAELIEKLRREMKIKRKRFQGTERENANGQILRNFLLAYGGKDSFFIYNSFGDEADTKGIISNLLNECKQVYLPRTEGAEMCAAPYGEMKAGLFGIEEPAGQAFSGEAEITVVPLLAVNGKGYRLGYGKGYYDRYLKGKKTRRVGIAYSFQIAEFENREWDEPLDELVTEKGIYYYGK